MKRGGPLQRKTPLKSGGSLARSGELKRTPLKPRSEKREKFMREERAPQVRALAEAGVTCEISMVLEEVGIPHRCAGQISGLHERRKRSSGGSLTNPANLIPACSWCNGYVEDAGKIIRERTGTALVVRQGDPEWERLGARVSRESAP